MGIDLSLLIKKLKNGDICDKKSMEVFVLLFSGNKMRTL